MSEYNTVWHILHSCAGSSTYRPIIGAFLDACTVQYKQREQYSRSKEYKVRSILTQTRQQSKTCKIEVC